MGMNDQVIDASRDQAVTAITAMTSAYTAAAAAIEAIKDPDEAFQLATTLWGELRTATDENGLLRARLAARIWELHELDLVSLASRLSQSGHSIGKSRAGQLIQSARNQSAQAHKQGEQA